MCGGRGTRLRAEGSEKPLIEVGGESMLSRIVDALRASDVGTVSAVVSPHAPATADRARHLSVPTIENPWRRLRAGPRDRTRNRRPAVTAPADLPLLMPEHVDDAVAESRQRGDGADRDATSLTVCVPAVLKRRLGASVDTAFGHGGRAITPTGLNVVADNDDTVALRYDARLSVNVNRPTDLELAEALCG